MPRTKISEFSATAADNTDIDSIDIAEGCAPSGINNAIRELMAQLKDFQTGAASDPFNGAVNGTLGATTPAAATVTSITDSGNLTFTGTGNRITGDFSNATHSSRVLFQTSTANSNTAVGAIPVGTGNTAQFIAYGNGDPTNSSYLQMLVSATEARINSGQLGSGSNLPLTVYTGGSERVRIDTSGNVGIGTSSPKGKLTVLAPSSTTLGDQATSALNIIGNNGASKFWQIAFGSYDTSFTNAPASIGYVQTTSSGFNNGALVFATRNVVTDTAPTEAMRIDSSGNLLVGTTTVNGRISSVPKTGFAPAVTAGTWANSAGISTSGSFGGGFSWIDGSGGYCAWAENNGADFVIAGGLTGNVVANGVFLNGFSATSWSARSDERLKQNLKPITDALNKTCSLRAVTGAYKNFPDEQQAFLLAQDVQKVLPEAVCVADKNSPEQYLGLAYTQVIPLLVAAIQEQQALIAQLQADVATLKTTP